MDLLIKQPRHTNHGFLFLQGVFKRDSRTLEDMLKDQLIGDDVREVYELSDLKQYNTVPVQFTSEESWPKSTNIQCWWCTCRFEGAPRFMATSIEPTCDGKTGVIISATDLKKVANKKSCIISTKGVYCSFNCVIAYIIAHIHDMFDRLNKLEMTKFSYELILKKKAYDIKPSPPPTEMIQFGGWLSESQYRAKIKALDE